ncbi:MAG: putative ABC transporter permease, partial [Clostridia bacterium]|nr:putative ABC transporter permease [Clostridia bacterium]
MQIFLLYLFLFLVGSFGGWICEVLFRRFFSAKKWVNPGFMKGPWLPLYGFGVVVMFTVCYLCLSVSPDTVRFFNPFGGLFEKDYTSSPTFADAIPVLVMWIGMLVLEFSAGLIFIKGFKVKLWDYSNLKGNIKGIVCPMFSLLWLFVALVFYYVIDPPLYLLSQGVYAYMFGENG